MGGTSQNPPEPTTRGSPKPIPLPSPLFFYHFFLLILGLKSFNGRQWGILQSISGVSGASGGLRSQNLDFLANKKSFYGNAHISGTRRPTGLAQVSKRPLDQGLRAWPFRLSVFTLVSKIAYVLSSPRIFHGMGQRSDSDLFWPFLTPPANPV